MIPYSVKLTMAYSMQKYIFMCVCVKVHGTKNFLIKSHSIVQLDERKGEKSPSQFKMVYYMFSMVFKMHVNDYHLPPFA